MICEGALYAPLCGLSVAQVEDLRGGHALRLEELDQLPVAPVLLRERIPHLFVLPFERADDKDPRSPWLPVAPLRQDRHSAHGCERQEQYDDTTTMFEKLIPSYSHRGYTSTEEFPNL
jgi:hypothetical protein